MKAVRCSLCNLLVAQDGFLGNLTVAVPGNHEPTAGEDGMAMPAEEAVCAGSELLGNVEEIEDG